MKNSELIKYEPTNLLNGIDQQRRVILRDYVIQQPCPSCGIQQNVFEWLRVDIDDYEFGKSKDDKPRPCIACDRELRFTVPFMVMGGPHWRWQLVPIPVVKRSGLHANGDDVI